MRLFSVFTIVVTLAAAAAAQLSPVSLSVQPVDQKLAASASGDREPAKNSKRALRITLKNTTSQTVTSLTVRWGIEKFLLRSWVKAVSGEWCVPFSFSARKQKPKAISGEQTLDLMPLEQKTIETDYVEALDRFGRDINEHRIGGHIVQLLIRGRIVAEQLTGSNNLKTCFDKASDVDPKRRNQKDQ